MPNPLIQIITDAKKAVAFRQVGENTITQPAAAGDIIRVRQAQIAHVVGSAAHPLSDPLRTAPGHVITLEKAILQRSRVLQAGAHLVVRDAGTQAFSSGVNESGEVPFIALQERAAGLNIAVAAPFSVVTPGADVSVSPLPVLTSKVRLDGFSNYGVRLSLTRDQQKQLGDGVLADSIMVSLALGIANVADHALLTAIAAAKPQAFSLAMAAAKGFRFAELRAIAGTAAAGAAVGQDGVLRVAGVAAELTDQVPETLAGNWQRAGVALFDEIQVIAERRDVQGRLIVTAWVGLEALLPDAGAFWKVAQ